MNTILGLKQTVSQKFLEDGTRIPVTLVLAANNPIVTIKTMEKHGYNAVQLGWGVFTKTQEEDDKKQGTKKKLAPRFLKEVRLPNVIDSETLPKVGGLFLPSDILKPGDIVDVTGISKGKGFAGGVKRYHFKGGPRTHGQSDRERAPGSIGQTTTPGRVYKGKRMAGKMGHETVTVKNLVIVGIEDGKILIKGVIPGIPQSLIVIKKTGEKKHFTPLAKKSMKEEAKTDDNKAEKETK